MKYACKSECGGSNFPQALNSCIETHIPYREHFLCHTVNYILFTCNVIYRQAYYALLFFPGDS